VANSGVFPHRPDLTVLQAVSMAGGLRTRAEERHEEERDAITRTGELDVLRLQRDHLMARLARLEAETARSDSVQFPKELAERRDEPAISELLEAEQLIFAAREDAYDTQLRTLEQLKRSLETEIPSLTAQLGTVDTQIRLIKEELDTVTTLLQAGLSNAPRRMDLERQIARTEGERLRVESGLLRAKQEISKAEISIVELRTGRTRDVRVELRESQSKLEELGRRIETASQLVDAAAAASPYVIDSDDSGRMAEPVYYLVRRVNDQTTELQVDETTPVQPGDTVKVYVRIARNQERSESKASNQLSSR
jgi:polysaccharide export outer membrane protein/exopolysaccharide production protein ExoF